MILFFFFLNPWCYTSLSPSCWLFAVPMEKDCVWKKCVWNLVHFYVLNSVSFLGPMGPEFQTLNILPSHLLVTIFAQRTLALNQTSKQRQKRQIWLRDYIVHHILKQIFRWYICGLSKANQKITARFNIWSNQDKNVAIIISANERKLNVYKNKQTNNINSNSCITLEFF